MNFDNEKKPDIAKTRGKWWDPSPETVPVVPIDQMANTISGIKEIIQNQLERLELLKIDHYIKLAKKNLTELDELLIEINSINNDPKLHLIMSIKITKIQDQCLKLTVVRPEIKSDNLYRYVLLELFRKYLAKAVLPHFSETDIQLQFHGQPFHSISETLHDGLLLSPILRGASLATDVGPDYICTTTAGKIDEVLSYALIHDTEIPLGAVYVLKPSAEDNYVGQTRTRNVDLHSNRLIAILVSEEVKKSVMAYAQKYDLADKVYEYFDWIKQFSA